MFQWARAKPEAEQEEIKHTEVSYIRPILSKDGVKPDVKKVDAITRMETPKDKKELQRFLGMATYLSKFIPNMSQRAAQLRSLLQKTSISTGKTNNEGVFRN